MEFEEMGRKGVALMVLLVLFATCLYVVPVYADQSSAQAEINSAKLKLVGCFAASKAAESAGANISQLTNALNGAGLLYSHAELAYSNGDFDAAQNFATQSQSVLSTFVSTANSLQATATQQRNQDFMLNFVGSIVGTVAVIVGCVAIWILLKRKYGKDGAEGLESATI